MDQNGQRTAQVRAERQLRQSRLMVNEQSLSTEMTKWTKHHLQDSTKWIKEFLNDLFIESMALVGDGNWLLIFNYLTLARRINNTMEKHGYFGNAEEMHVKMEALKWHAHACFQCACSLPCLPLPEGSFFINSALLYIENGLQSLQKVRPYEDPINQSLLAILKLKQALLQALLQAGCTAIDPLQNCLKNIRKLSTEYKTFAARMFRFDASENLEAYVEHVVCDITSRNKNTTKASNLEPEFVRPVSPVSTGRSHGNKKGRKSRRDGKKRPSGRSDEAQDFRGSPQGPSDVTSLKRPSSLRSQEPAATGSPRAKKKQGKGKNKQARRSSKDVPQSAHPRRDSDSDTASEASMMQASQAPQVEPFCHEITVACGQCFDYNSDLIQVKATEGPYCTGNKKHPWGQYSINVVYSNDRNKWMRVYPRPLVLKADLFLKLCDKKLCKKPKFGKSNACTHPHCQEELDMWNYQVKHNLSRLEDIIERQQDLNKSVKGADADREKSAECHFRCPFCNFSCTARAVFEAHVKSLEHKARICFDRDVDWKHRDPPMSFGDGKYKLCEKNAKGQCEYSGKVGPENECMDAHSLEERNEWERRYNRQMVQLKKAREMNLYTWLDDLVYDIDFKRRANVLTEVLEDVDISCNNPTTVHLEAPLAEGQEIEWEFTLTSKQKPLHRVGLLYDEHRHHFNLTEPCNEVCPQSCPGLCLMIGENALDYKLKVQFNCTRRGHFEQYLIFDFGERPVLFQHLVVNIGVDEGAGDQADSEELTAELHGSMNASEIIEFSEPSRRMHELISCYPQPDIHGEDICEDVLGIAPDKYKQNLHQMLDAEEREMMKRVSGYTVATCMDVIQRVPEGYNQPVQQGSHYHRFKLFGRIELERSLNDDSEASDIVQKYVDNILIRFGQSGSRYEARLIQAERASLTLRNALVVSLSPRCVRDLGLCAGANVTVTIQLHINRHPILTMHDAVDRLSCMEVVFPEPKQPKRFGNDEAAASSSVIDDLSERQMQVVQYISTAGGSVSGPASLHSGPASLCSGPASHRSGPASLRSGPASLHSGLASLHSGPATLRGGPVSLHSGSAALHSGPASLHSGPATLRGGPVSLRSGPASLHSGPASLRSRSASLHSGPASLRSGPSLLLGPYGTGKTYTLARAVQQTLTQRPDARVLICTHSNSAADLYITEHLSEFCKENVMDVCRIYSANRRLNTIPMDVTAYCLFNEKGELRLPNERDYQEWVHATMGATCGAMMHPPRLILATLSTAAHLARRDTLRGYFTHIIIDEAGQALETEAIIPLALATDRTCVVLAGDHMQITPKVYSPFARKAKFNLSLLHRLFLYDKQNSCNSTIILHDNYRSCQPILDFLRVTYGTAFSSQCAGQKHPSRYPLQFTAAIEGEERCVGRSYINEKEAMMTVDQVVALCHDWPEERWGDCQLKDIAVLLSYKGQVDFIRKELRNRGLSDVTVDMVQNVQGKQFRAVFISTVRTRSALNKVGLTMLPKAKCRNAAREYTYGFLTDRGLLNTALTRAKSLITVIGDPFALCSLGECQRTWERFIETCERHRSIHPLNLTVQMIKAEVTASQRFIRSSGRLSTFISASNNSSKCSDPLPDGVANAVSEEELQQAWSRAKEVGACSLPVLNQRNDADYQKAYPHLAENQMSQGHDDIRHDLILQACRDEMELDAPEEAELEPEAKVEKTFPEREVPRIIVDDGNGPRIYRNGRFERPGDVRVLYNQDDEEVYDSDDENYDDSQDGVHDRTNEFLCKSTRNPDKFKIATFHQETDGRMFGIPQGRQAKETIKITCPTHRGHALHGDKVLIEIIEAHEEDHEDDDAPPVDEKICGKVVGVIKGNFDITMKKMVCSLDPYCDDIMVPLDRTSPKMFILGQVGRQNRNRNVTSVPVYNVTAASTRPEPHCRLLRNVEIPNSCRAQKIFLVRYLDWPSGRPYPVGVVIDELPPGTTVETGLNLLKLIYGIKEIPNRHQEHYIDNQAIPGGKLSDRPIHSDRKVFTIGPEDCYDLPFALSIKELPGERYQIGTYISEVSNFVEKGCPIDREAYKRGVSFYHPFHDGTVHMLPNVISEGLGSFLPLEDRCAVSVTLILDQHGHIIEEPSIQRSVVQSCKRVTFEDAELLLDRRDAPQDLQDVEREIQLLGQLAEKRRASRLGRGSEVYEGKDDGGAGLSYPHSTSLVDELKILTNSIVAQKLLTVFPNCTPLCRQLPPSEHQLKIWMTRHHKAASHSLVLPRPLEQHDEAGGDRFVMAKEVWEEIEDITNTGAPSENDEKKKIKSLLLSDRNHPLQAVALKGYQKIVENEEYVDTSQPCGVMTSHFTLKMAEYVHVTDPLQSYMDLVVLRLLVAALETPDQQPYTESEIWDLTQHCNNKVAGRKCFWRDTMNLRLALKMKEAPLPVTSFIANIAETEMDMMLPYQSYVPAKQTMLEYGLFKPCEKPKIEPNSLKMVWKSRMYDYGRNTLAHSPAMAHSLQQTFSIPKRRAEALKASVSNADGIDIHEVEMAGIHGQYNPTPFSEGNDRPAPANRPVRREREVLHFEREFVVGHVLELQLHPELEKGILTPKIQLATLAESHHLCCEHRRGAVNSFAAIATDKPGQERDIQIYKDKWQKITTMMAAHSAVRNDDTVIMENVPVTWQDRTKGYFDLRAEFLRACFIRIFVNRDDRSKELEYICIRYNNLEVSLDSLGGILEHDVQRNPTGPFNKNDWKRYTYVAHCRVTGVLDDRFLNGSGNQDMRRNLHQAGIENDRVPMARIEFALHQSSVPFPAVLLEQEVMKNATVEFILKPEPARRVEDVIAHIAEAPALVKDIILHRSTPPDNEDQTLAALLRLGAGMIDLRVPGTRLPPLNDSQRNAVHAALGRTFSIIQGPPGTGKTVTGAYLAYFFARLNRRIQTPKEKHQVLYCGPSNKSVDVVARYLRLFSDISVVRVYGESLENEQCPIPGIPAPVRHWSKREARISPDLEDISLHRLIRKAGAPYALEIADFEEILRTSQRPTYSMAKQLKQTIFKAVKEELRKHDVVLCTCHAAGAQRISLQTTVAQCIVDEAGMCSEPESLIPMCSTKPKQIVLIGDHMQLRCIVTEPNAKQLGVDISLLEKYKEKATMLTTQYRMHQAICEFPSGKFYDGKLETDRSVTERGPDILRNLWPSGGDRPRVFCHVAGREETLSVKAEEGNEMSKCNMAEVRQAMSIVQLMIRRRIPARDIVVLSQYRLQCAKLEDELERMGAPYNKVKVSTVVKSQGSEWDYVIWSNVRSLPRHEIESKPGRGWLRKHLGFVDDQNQMNVALTRAKRGLVIIGNEHLLKTHSCWRSLLDLYRTTGCMRGGRDYPQFIPPRR